MRTLYHYPLCPFSRRVRLLMAEKKLDFELEFEAYWEKRPDFLEMNPACTVPVLVELNGSVIADGYVIGEYLDEAYPERPLYGQSLEGRVETRRLVSWFDHKFYEEVTKILLFERVLKRYQPHVPGSVSEFGPNSKAIRLAKEKIHEHLEVLSDLADRRKWLAGEEISAADLAAAAHLSVVDYLGDVPWEQHEAAKDWYMRLKSRPSFRMLLAERIPGLKPPEHYTSLDF